MALMVCTRCERHVRKDDERCPFCDAPLTPEAPSSRGPRVSRGALLGAVGLAIACGTTAPPDDGGTDDAAKQDSAYDGPVAAYGGPPIDASPPADAKSELPAPAYGGPPTDGGGG
jgi:hypothetical protein